MSFANHALLFAFITFFPVMLYLRFGVNPHRQLKNKYAFYDALLLVFFMPLWPIVYLGGFTNGKPAGPPSAFEALFGFLVLLWEAVAFRLVCGWFGIWQSKYSFGLLCSFVLGLVLATIFALDVRG